MDIVYTWSSIPGELIVNINALNGKNPKYSKQIPI